MDCRAQERSVIIAPRIPVTGLENVFAAVLYGLGTGYEKIYYPSRKTLGRFEEYFFSLMNLEMLFGAKKRFIEAILTSRTNVVSLPDARAFPELFGDGVGIAPVKGNTRMVYVPPSCFEEWGCYVSHRNEAMLYLKEFGVR